MHILKKQMFRHFKNHRSVNTWSPLAIAFNSITKEKYNFNLSKVDTVSYFSYFSSSMVHILKFFKILQGLFGIPELKTPTGFSILKDQAMTQIDALIIEATSQDRKRKMVEIFDDMSNELCKVADLAEFIRIAHPKKEFVEVAENACIFISGIVEK